MSIPQKIQREAHSIAHSLYRLNAKGAVAYAFNYDENKGITRGEYIWASELDDAHKIYDAYLDFNTDEIMEL